MLQAFHRVLHSDRLHLPETMWPVSKRVLGACRTVGNRIRAGVVDSYSSGWSSSSFPISRQAALRLHYRVCKYAIDMCCFHKHSCVN